MCPTAAAAVACGTSVSRGTSRWCSGVLQRWQEGLRGPVAVEGGSPGTAVEVSGSRAISHAGPLFYDNKSILC